ncbi:MAG: TolC family protein [Novosphingobium sp.]
MNGQDAPGVPPSSVVIPSASVRSKAALDEPSGPPRYMPGLPEGTPADAGELTPPAPVTLFTDALQRSYWTHPNLLAQRARVRSADYRMPQARAASGPSISAEASYGYQRDNVELSTGSWAARSGWASTASAIVNQPLYTFGRNAAGEHQAGAEIAFERASLRTTEMETLFGAIAAYAGLLRDRSDIGVVADDLALLERELSDNKARFEKREVTVSDLQQVETRVEQARAQMLLARRTASSAEANFLAAIGAPAGNLQPPNPLSMPVASLEEAYAYADSNSPVLAAAYAPERISRAARDGARADMLPRFDLRGRADYGTISPYHDDPRQTTLRGEVVVSAPVFASGALRARSQEAEAANDADWRLLDAALRQNRFEVASAWNDWVATSAAIDPLRRSAEQARAAFDGALLQEKAGFRTTLDVLQLARDLLSARSSYNAATANAYIAQARLLAAMGALEQSWLFPDAPVYDPDAHYQRTKNDGMIPVIVPALRAVDGVTLGGGKNRAVRDPAASTAAPAVTIPPPAAQPVPTGQEDRTGSGIIPFAVDSCGEA